MRIIGYIEHPVLKITVFKMDTRISIKFESGFYEQTYKFRISDQIEDLESVKQLVDAEFLQAVERELHKMHQIKNQALRRLLPPEEEEFDEII